MEIVLKYIWYKPKSIFIKLNQWETLRVIGNQKIVQLTILIPVIGYYIIFSEQFCTFTKTISSIEIGISCTEYPSQKTFLMYFGFSFLAIGSLLYSFYCPTLIKKYVDKFDYIRSVSILFNRSALEATVFGLAHKNDGKILPSDIKYPFKKIREAQEEFLKTAERTMQGIDDSSTAMNAFETSKHLQSEQYDILFENSKEVIMGMIYDAHENDNAFLRATTTVFYVLGFSIIGGLAIKTFITILTIYLANLFG